LYGASPIWPTAIRLPFSSFGLPMPFCAISANSPRFEVLPISANDASRVLATMPCSREWLTITAWPLVSIATPVGCTPNCRSTSSPCFW
jgi:hypothetical protein